VGEAPPRTRRQAQSPRDGCGKRQRRGECDARERPVDETGSRDGECGEQDELVEEDRDLQRADVLGVVRGHGCTVAPYPASMLDLRYDPVSRSGYVRLRQGKVARTRELSPTANGEYDSRDRLVAIQITELDETAAEFLRTADEETLLRVIREQAGRRKAGSQPPPGVVREPRRAR
jgi:hypothetical protein